MTFLASPTLDGLEQLLERQRSRGLERCASAEEFDELARGSADLAVLLTDDPVRNPESWDMAVILPEVLKTFCGRLAAVSLMPEPARQVARSYGVSRFPSLLFVRGGDYVGVLEGVYDWQVLGPAVHRLLDTPASRKPGIGIPVHAETPSGACH